MGVRLPLFLLAAVACDSGLGPNDVATVVVTPSSATVTAGAGIQLTATAKSSSGTVLSDRAVTWMTSAPAVASVDGAGMVTGLSPGTATITASAEGKSGSAIVTVANGPSLRIVSGDGQEGKVTDTLAAPLVVQALDPDGNGLPGVAVTFLVTGGTADLTVNFVTTDSDGRASTIVVFGTQAGPVTVAAGAGSLSETPVTFALRAAPDSPLRLVPIRGENQSAFTDHPLPLPIVVEAVDRFDNPIPDLTVEWVATAGGGAPATPTTITDDSGHASVTWVVGSTQGTNAIEARASGVDPVAFSALAVPPGPGRIAFTRHGPPNSIILLMQPDGSGVDTLSGSVEGDLDPAWSADGSRLVFANFAANPARISGFNSFADVMVMNADGSGRTRLTDHFGSVSGPVLSPDGSKIAFASDQTGQSEIYVMNADGSGVVQLTTGGGYAPSWSPDGTRIAVGVQVAVSFPEPKAFVMNADGSNVVPLVPGEDPAWSPDGSVIALTVSDVGDLDDFKLAFIRPDGTGLTQLQSIVGVHTPAWSPDGSKIAVRVVTPQAGGHPAESLLFTINADGTAPMLLSGPADQLPAWGP